MISTLTLRRIEDDPKADILLNRIREEGFPSLKHLLIETVFRLEGIDDEQANALKPLFCHPQAETITPNSLFDQKEGPILEVGYQRAVTDPELPSILRSAFSLGVEGLKWVRIAHRYQFQGVDQQTAEEIVHRFLYNPQVQVIISPEERWSTLRPRGESGPVTAISLEGLQSDDLLELSERMRLFLNIDQMHALQEISQDLKRPLTDAEVEMFAQTWSDHCFHTTWKSLGLLQALFEATTTIDHPLVLSVFEDNAGAVSFYDGWALTIKGETHNSPSAVSPYGGIMTKHGGVIRDTLGCGQGAWPIGGSTVMGLGQPTMEWASVPEGALHPRTILQESIRGTADYSNPMGIPMMFPVYRFHPGYTGKCFALGHSIGLVPADRAKKGHPRPGDHAVLIGGLTGRDGLHGATVSSGSMTSDTATVDAAHVQIGHPIEERKFMEAIPDLRDHDCLRAITDLGAAGLSSAAGEMGSETGVWINLAWVPLKTEGLHPWEIWISESQERMLLCVPPEKIEEAMQRLERYEVTANIIGRFTDSHRCQVVFDPSLGTDAREVPMPPEMTGEHVVDLDFQILRKGCPLPDIPQKPQQITQTNFQPPRLDTEDDWQHAIHGILGHLNVCDQSVAGFQFDKTVQGCVVTGPYGGIDGNMPNDIWAAAPIRGKTYGAVASLGFNPFYGDIDPGVMAKLMILESISKLVAAGANAKDVVLCDNFYTPRVTPEVASGLVSMVHTCCDLSSTLGTPFISGKDSSSGTFVDAEGNRLDIPPTLCVLALGRIADVMRLVPKPWQELQNKLILIGPLTSELGGSVYLDTLNQRGVKLPDPPVTELQRMWQELQPFNEKGIIRSAAAIAEGGLLRRLFEQALGSGKGCSIDLDPLRERIGADAPETGLFAEMIGTICIEVPSAHADDVAAALEGVVLGDVISEPVLSIQTGAQQFQWTVESLTAVWEKPFAEVAR